MIIISENNSALDRSSRSWSKMAAPIKTRAEEGLPIAGEVQTEQERVMATSSSVIVDLDKISVDFTELPPDKLLCPECNCVYRDPHLSSCCHRTCCLKCISKLKDSPCPRCSEEGWLVDADAVAQRSINDLYVRCLHVTDGCLWFGRLEQLYRHIDRESGTSGCIFIKLACPHDCGQKLVRKLLEEHVTKRCPNRPYMCEYCQDYEGHYHAVETYHFPDCPQYLLPCPNSCPEKMIARSNFDHHIHTTCEYQENIPCPLSSVGCGAKLRRKNIAVHLEKGVANHMKLLSTALLNNKSELEEKLINLPVSDSIDAPSTFDSKEIKVHVEEALKSKDNEILQLKQQIEQLNNEKEEQHKLLQSITDKHRHTLDAQEKRLSLTEQLNHTLIRDLGALRQFIPNPLPISFTINKVEQLRLSNKWWYSRPFFSHVQGYKFGMFVFCNGVLDGKGTHISVFLYLVRGEFDDELDWPFHGNVTIQLLNQRADRQHYQKVIRFTDDTPPAVCNRVMNAEMAKEGNGPTQFISQADLTYNQEKDTEYIRDDSLKLRVVSINIKSGSTPRTPLGSAGNTGTLSRIVPDHNLLIRAQTQSVESCDGRTLSPVDKSPSHSAGSTRSFTPIENGCSSP